MKATLVLAALGSLMMVPALSSAQLPPPMPTLPRLPSLPTLRGPPNDYMQPSPAYPATKSPPAMAVSPFDTSIRQEVRRADRKRRLEEEYCYLVITRQIAAPPYVANECQ